MLVTEAEHDGLGRDETTLERSDRNLVELLQEVRVVQTGVQVLFGFLLMAPLTAGFRRLGSVLQKEYFVTLLFAAAGAILLIAPTAFHRVLFRRGDKEYLIRVANRLTIVGLAAVGVAMVGSIVFVAGILFAREIAVIVGALACCVCGLLWAVLPLLRRRQLDDSSDLAIGPGSRSRTTRGSLDNAIGRMGRPPLERDTRASRSRLGRQ
jgi:hypothetical protein